MDLFDRVSLRTNVAKKVIMACQPCRALGGHSLEVYGLRMTDDGHNYGEWLRQWVH